MSAQRGLTPEEQAELDQLNNGIALAIGRRRAWLDAKMEETSTLKVGDDIYGWTYEGGERKLGVVSKLYRFNASRNDLLDDNHHCDYEYKTSPMSTDNTSRQSGVRFGTREDAIANAEYRAKILRGDFNV